MKRLIAILLSISLILVGCVSATAQDYDYRLVETVQENKPEFIKIDLDTPQFTVLDDPEYIQYLKDDIYETLEYTLSSDEYRVDGVTIQYISKEYLEELDYNSQNNIFFGYTLDDVEKIINGEKYVFTLGDDGTTVVKPFSEYDQTFDQILKNVAIGTGVILICVTVSVVSAGAGAPAAVSAVFAASAKTGTTMAISSGVISGAIAGTVEGLQTGDVDAALKTAALEGSEGFKWGAIIGAVTGGVSEAINLAAPSASTSLEIPTPREAEEHALLKYPGREQVSFLNHEEVPINTPCATRPDIVRMVDNHIEAIEVKRYNLESSTSLNTLYSELKRQVTQRVNDLPTDATQRIVLNVENRTFSEELVSAVKNNIQNILWDVYPNIPVDVMW